MKKYFLSSILITTFYLFSCAQINFAIASEIDLDRFKISQGGTQPDANSSAKNGQAGNDAKETVEVKLEDLRVPDAPALSIIGSPKIEISKPGTPRAFGLSLIESFADSESGIPQNLAIDLAPYWWWKRPLNTLDDEICRPSSLEDEASKCDPIGFGESLLRSLTISIASSQEDLELEGDDVDLTRLGLGLRFSLLSGHINPAFKNRYELFPGEQACIYKVIDGEKIDFENDEERTQCLTENSDKLTKLGKELEELGATRVGWQLDFALASALDFQEDSFDNAEFTRLGTWLTASYRPTNSEEKASSVTFLGIGRYLYDDFEDKGDNLVDLGGRVIWSPSETPLSASVEYLRRFGDDDDDRLVGLAEYKFNDTYSIFASFGKTFEEDFTGNDDLVTFLGINIGLGQKPKALVSP